jgi:EAL domain-containing protein (putative c-di-GMP-specific phosphodiesterase class I)
MGKVSHPQSALSARAATAGADSATAEALGWQLRAALPPMRLHSVSIYDSQGNVVWLSEGALGPDEHSLVLESLDALTADSSKSCCEHGLEDGRIAAFLAVRAPQGHLVGLAMILADFKTGGEGLIERILSAPTRTIMQKLAVLLRPAGPRTPEADPTALVLSLATEASPVTAEPQPAAAPAHAARKSQNELTPCAVNDILEFELADMPVPAAVPATASPPTPPIAAMNGHARSGGVPSALGDSGAAPPLPASALADATGMRLRAPAAPTATDDNRMLRPTAPADTTSSRILGGSASTGTARAFSLDPSLVTLEMLPYVKLRAGGRMRRFEVLAAGTARELRDPAVLDDLTMQRLLAWLGAHRAAWTVEPASFTLNLSIATLEDEGFLRRLAMGLKASGIAPDTIGFEIAEPLCTQRRAQVERFMGACEKLGCFLVIGDFSLDSAVVPLLRSKALRLVKIDARLTGGALRDKLSQALVVAVVQAVKVLGMHCAARQVDSQAALQWLTAVGCDFAQGPMLGRPQPLETLLGSRS